VQYKIEITLLQFSLANCVEAFLQCPSLRTFRSSLQYVNVLILTQTLTLILYSVSLRVVVD